jgi:hypothetical protein
VGYNDELLKSECSSMLDLFEKYLGNDSRLCVDEALRKVSGSDPTALKNVLIEAVRRAIDAHTEFIYEVDMAGGTPAIAEGLRAEGSDLRSRLDYELIDVRCWLLEQLTMLAE